MWIIFYILSITTANVVTSSIAPLVFLGMLIPAGTFLIAITFPLRDMIQIRYGKMVSYYAVIGATLLSAIVVVVVQAPMQIVIASAITFSVSELADTEFFTRFKGRIDTRIAVSGIASSIIDSLLFTLIAGFPFVACVGQTVVKIVIQLFSAIAYKLAFSNGQSNS